jgi:hypothetical protein
VNDRIRGIYHKFNVERTDGSSRKGAKHDGCTYFVLDCDHAPHAKTALASYAESCRAEYPSLAADLDDWLKTCEFGAKPHHR